MIRIEVEDRLVLSSLQALSARLKNPGPALGAIGEDLMASTKRRFDASTAPDGTPWAPNTETTYLRYLGVFKGSFNGGGGRLSKAGTARAGAKKPLIGETRSLSSTISYRVIGDTLFVGSPMEYAATHQFGAEKGAFGRTRSGSPIPWGDIPKRPFLGISDGDRQDILEVVGEYLNLG